MWKLTWDSTLTFHPHLEVEGSVVESRLKGCQARDQILRQLNQQTNQYIL